MQYSDSILNTPSSFIRNILKVTDSEDVISFAGGLPNPISFPIEQLKQSVTHAIDESGAKVFQYTTTKGTRIFFVTPWKCLTMWRQVAEICG